MKTYKHDTELMINTRSVFGEERKSTPVQDVTTTSAQINHTPADLCVWGVSISVQGEWRHTHTHTGAYTHKHKNPASLCAAFTFWLCSTMRQVRNGLTATGFQGCWVYTFNSPFLISQISLIREL